MVFYRTVLLVLSVRVQLKCVAVNGSRRSSRRKAGVLLEAADSGVLLLWLRGLLSSLRLFLCVMASAWVLVPAGMLIQNPAPIMLFDLLSIAVCLSFSNMSCHCLSTENRDLLPEFHMWRSDGRQKEVIGRNGITPQHKHHVLRERLRASITILYTGQHFCSNLSLWCKCVWHSVMANKKWHCPHSDWFPVTLTIPHWSPGNEGWTHGINVSVAAAPKQEGTMLSPVTVVLTVEPMGKLGEFSCNGGVGG